MLLELNNVHKTSVSFRLNLIHDDPDDNKFVDCAFANNVHYLVTNDRHFNVLKKIKFPKVQVITIDRFEEILKQL